MNLTRIILAPAQPQTLTLTRDGQTYIFRYMPGDELSVLTAIRSAACDPASDFDWFDADMLVQRLRQRMANR